MMNLGSLPNVSLPLPWHSGDWTHFSDSLASGQLPHALLLLGGQYSGKTQLALAMSRLLLCSQGESGNNCGHCHACELSASGSHGDFKWVQPEEKSRVIKIDQVRELVQFTQKTAAFGMRKVIVIAPADSMNVNAFNALLKSLEEPTEGTYLILVCNRLQGVPATIRSRCQILRLAMPDADASLSWLDEVTGQRKESQKLLTLAADRPLLAKQLYESADTEAYAQRSLAIQALLQGHISLSQAGALWDDVEVSVFLEQCSGQLQHLLRALSGEQLRTREVQAAFGLLDNIVRLQQAVNAGANPGRQLLVESVLSKVWRELGGTPLGDNIQSQQGDVRV